jgi:hypothetical protein
LIEQYNQKQFEKYLQNIKKQSEEYESEKKRIREEYKKLYKGPSLIDNDDRNRILAEIEKPKD